MYMLSLNTNKYMYKTYIVHLHVYLHVHVYADMLYNIHVPEYCWQYCRFPQVCGQLHSGSLRGGGWGRVGPGGRCEVKGEGVGLVRVVRVGVERAPRGMRDGVAVV